MSTSLTPATPPIHNPPSNAPVDPTMALIALMHQKLQKNSTMMGHMKTRTSLSSTQQTPTGMQYKPQPPPFPKWDRTPPTTLLLLAQILTHKAEAVYSRVHDWTQTTQLSKHLSITISAEMLTYLPRSVSSMFLNDTRFASDRVDILSHLLNLLNPSSSENLLLAISDITCLVLSGPAHPNCPRSSF